MRHCFNGARYRGPEPAGKRRAPDRETRAGLAAWLLRRRSGADPARGTAGPAGAGHTSTASTASRPAGGLTRRIRLMRRKPAATGYRILRVSHFLRVIAQRAASRTARVSASPSAPSRRRQQPLPWILARRDKRGSRPRSPSGAVKAPGLREKRGLLRQVIRTVRCLGQADRLRADGLLAGATLAPSQRHIATGQGRNPHRGREAAVSGLRGQGGQRDQHHARRRTGTAAPAPARPDQPPPAEFRIILLTIPETGPNYPGQIVNGGCRY